MTFLTCNHCFHPNELTSEYLTFCGKCGKKITNNYHDWSKENPGRSFGEFKDIVCHTTILHWEPVDKSAERKESWSKHMITIAASAILFTVLVMWGASRGPEVAGNLEEWALRTIQFNNPDTDLWQTSIIREGNFQIKFPSTPEKRAESSETPMGPVETISYLYEPDIGDDDNINYSASYLSYPVNLMNSRIINDAQIEQFLRYVVEGIVRNDRARLESSKDISYGLHPGKELKMNYNNGLAEIKCRVYLVENTLYTLKVTSASHSKNNKAREFFLNSFKLLEYAQGLEIVAPGQNH